MKSAAEKGPVDGGLRMPRVTRKLTIVIVAALLVATTLVYSLVKTPQGSPPSASFEWSMQPRFEAGAYNESTQGQARFRCYVLPENTHRDPVCPTRPWVVTFDGSSSITSGDPSYAWTIANAECDSYAASRIVCRYAKLGTYDVTFRVADRWGRTDVASGNVTLDDKVVVVLGDSLAAGEGNPDTPRKIVGYNEVFGVQIPIISDPVWQDKRCHRSALSGHAQAAKAIEDSDPHVSVTFVDLACSGAGIQEGLLGPYVGQDYVAFTCPSHPTALTCPAGGISGARHFCPFPQGLWEDQCIEVLDPQVDQLERLLCPVPIATDFWGVNQGHCAQEPRRVDYLMMSVGANDLAFGWIVRLCTMDKSCQDELAAPLATLLGNLPSSFDRLNDAIRAKLNVDPKHVYVTEYPDVTRNDVGNFCHMLQGADEIAWDAIENWISLHPVETALIALEVAYFTALLPIPAVLLGMIAWAYAPALDGFTPDESQWAYNQVVLPLNRIVFEHAAAFGWTYVGGIMYLFRNHGACASDHWVNRLKESLWNQGDLVGTMHPNAAGHQLYRDRLVMFILQGAGPSFLPLPAYNSLRETVVSQESEAGWFTGQCTYALGNFGNPSCGSDAVGFTILVSDPNFISSASISINGIDVSDVILLPSSPPSPHDLGVRADFDCTPAPPAPTAPPSMICNHFVQSLTMQGWLLRIISEGRFHLRLTTWNQIYLASSSYEFDIAVDFVNPSVQGSISGGMAGLNGWFTSPPTLILVGSDTPMGSGMKGVEYSVDGGAPVLWEPCWWTSGAYACFVSARCWTSPSGDTVCWQVPLLCIGSGAAVETCHIHVTDDGIHQVEYWAVDLAGRRSSSQFIQLKIDKTAPVVSVDSAVDGNGRAVYLDTVTGSDSIAISFTATDAVGVTNVRCVLKSQMVELVVVDPCVGPQVFSNLARGRGYHFSAKALDDAGNVGLSIDFSWSVT